MQQRRLRLGDILDDYCPRERRITNHVIVALVEEEVKQTRCATCDADHEYKQARAPLSRRRKAADVTPSELAQRPPVRADAEPAEPSEPSEPAEPDTDVLAGATPFLDESDSQPADDTAPALPEPLEEDWPVHRPLIRATLPRPEGQSPERKAPDFTMRQAGGRFDATRSNGGRQRGRPRQAQGPSGGHARFGARQGTGQGQGQGQGAPGQRQGNRSGNAAGGRTDRPQGQNRGPRPGSGPGRKRGR
jgi:hypothetical protein